MATIAVYATCWSSGCYDIDILAVFDDAIRDGVYCLDSSLNRTKAKGKVLVCRHAGSSSESKLEKIIIVKETSGVPMILIDEVDKGVAIPFNIPATTVSFPTIRVLSSKTFLGAQPAPRVVAFSSRVPNS
uniref:Serine protease n=1 Tax=Solanum tuberosum TaxID=4113 RepID=M1CJ68_SOLTU